MLRPLPRASAPPGARPACHSLSQRLRSSWCWSFFSQGSCCNQTTTQTATFDNLNLILALTCGDLLSSYTGSSCCSADLAKVATLNIQTIEPSAEPSIEPSAEQTSAPTSEQTSAPTSEPSAEQTSAPTSDQQTTACVRLPSTGAGYYSICTTDCDCELLMNCNYYGTSDSGNCYEWD